MINFKCPICKSEKYEVLKGYKEIGDQNLRSSLVLCDFCGHHFLEIPEEVNFNHLYSAGRYTVIDTRDSFIDLLLSFDNDLILRTLSKLKTNNKVLLDFGCGKGVFLKSASKYGWSVKGIETSRKRAEFGKNNYHLDIDTNEFKGGFIKGGPFNVILLLHVLEHLNDPKYLLKELTNNLVLNGYLIVEVPLFESFQSRLSKRYWMHLDPPFHISHFTKKRLLSMTEELGFQTMKLEYFSIHLGILGMVQSLMRVFKYKKDIIYELKFHKTLYLVCLILIVLPIATVFEGFAVLFSRGGIIRLYCKKIS